MSTLYIAQRRLSTIIYEKDGGHNGRYGAKILNYPANGENESFARVHFAAHGEARPAPRRPVGQPIFGECASLN